MEYYPSEAEEKGRVVKDRRRDAAKGKYGREVRDALFLVRKASYC